MITARDKYLDVHRWFFVPSSFRLILQDLRELGLLELNERAFLSTTHIEFYCFLSKAAPRGSEDRVSLALAALREQADALSSVELKA